VAGNYVPVNLACGLNDSSLSMFVLVDRAQGCVSMADGQLEFLLHRRLFVDDGKGLYEPLNETEAIIPGRVTTRLGKGLVVTGKHYLVLQPAPVQRATDIVRTLASRVYSPLHLVSSPLNASIPSYLSTHTSTSSFLSTPLPLNVELITLQTLPSPSNRVLLRLSHLFGLRGIDNSTALSIPVTVNLTAMLARDVVTVEEVSVTANQAPVAKRAAYTWRLEGEAEESARDGAEGEQGTLDRRQRMVVEDQGLIVISPMEVRTFLVQFAQQTKRSEGTVVQSELA